MIVWYEMSVAGQVFLSTAGKSLCSSFIGPFQTVLKSLQGLAKRWFPKGTLLCHWGTSPPSWCWLIFLAVEVSQQRTPQHPAPPITQPIQTLTFYPQPPSLLLFCLRGKPRYFWHQCWCSWNVFQLIASQLVRDLQDPLWPYFRSKLSGFQPINLLSCNLPEGPGNWGPGQLKSWQCAFRRRFCLRMEGY